MTSPLSGPLARTINKVFGKTLFLDATLTRDGAPTGPAYDPTPGTTVVYTCKAIAQEYSTGIQGQGLVAGSDINVMILAKSFKNSSGASVDLEPQSMDRIAIASQGIAGTVVPETTSGLKAVTSDPARATWSCRVIV